MKNQDSIPFEGTDSSASGNNSGLFRRLMSLLSRAKISDDARHDLVYSWTKGRTMSSKELTVDELRDLVWKFENHFDAPAVDLYLEAECKKLRAVVLKIATDTGIKEPYDFDRFNKFMKSHSILKKELHKYKLAELHDLVKQFRGLQGHFNRSAAKIGTKAWFHIMGFQMPVEN